MTAASMPAEVKPAANPAGTVYGFCIPFNEQDCHDAYSEWRCSCGPAALAAVLGKSLADIRPACELVNFPARGYMNVSMMREAIRHAGGLYREICHAADYPFNYPCKGLVRIQFGGPWIQTDGQGRKKPARWAAQHTHWVASWIQGVGKHFIFDINSGLTHYEQWALITVPRIAESIKRCDGSWYLTHAWEVRT